MRKGVPLPERAAPEARRFGRAGLAVVLGLLLVGGIGGYVAWSRLRPAQVGDSVPNRPLAANELAGHIERLGADRHVLAPYFEADRHVRGYFERALAAGDDATKLRAVARQLREAVASGTVRTADPRGMRSQPVRTPSELARALTAGRLVEASPIELVLLAVAALRDEDVPARVIEVFTFEQASAPPDPVGRLGHFAVGLVDPRGNVVAEVASPGERQPAAAGSRVLDDVAALGAIVLVRAGVAFGRDRDVQAALASGEESLRFDPRSPSARSLRATVLAGLGDAPAAIEEARAALALRRDAPRLALVAGLLLSTGELTEAESLVREGLTLAPDHGASHAVLAAIALGRNEPDRALAELAIVERLDPGFERLDMLAALANGARGNQAEATERLDRYVASRPMDVRVHLDAAGVAAQVGMRARMLAELRRAIELTSGEARDELRRTIGQTFGIGVMGELTTAGVTGFPAPDAGTETPGASGAAPRAEPPPVGGTEPGQPPAAVPDLDLRAPGLGQRPSRRSLLGPQ